MIFKFIYSNKLLQTLMGKNSANQLNEEKLIFRLPYELTSRGTDMYSRLGMGYLVNLFVLSAGSGQSYLELGSW